MNKEESRIAFKESIIGRVSAMKGKLTNTDEIILNTFLNKIITNYEIQIQQDFLKEVLPEESNTSNKRHKGTGVECYYDKVFNKCRQEIINKAKAKGIEI